MVSIHTWNFGTSNLLNQTLMGKEGKIISDGVWVGDFGTSHSKLNPTEKPKC